MRLQNKKPTSTSRHSPSIFVRAHYAADHMKQAEMKPGCLQDCGPGRQLRIHLSTQTASTCPRFFVRTHHAAGHEAGEDEAVRDALLVGAQRGGPQEDEGVHGGLEEGLHGAQQRDALVCACMHACNGPGWDGGGWWVGGAVGGMCRGGAAGQQRAMRAPLRGGVGGWGGAPVWGWAGAGPRLLGSASMPAGAARPAQTGGAWPP
jgi:hypothetical protein